MPEIAGKWLGGKTVTIGYYAMVEFSKVAPVADYLGDTYTWHDVNSPR
jgi:hypothetical protein